MKQRLTIYEITLHNKERQVPQLQELSQAQLEQALLKLARDKREVIPVFEVQSVWAEVLVLVRTSGKRIGLLMKTLRLTGHERV
jgi:hypothetical protein